MLCADVGTNMRDGMIYMSEMFDKGGFSLSCACVSLVFTNRNTVHALLLTFTAVDIRRLAGCRSRNESVALDAICLFVWFGAFFFLRVRYSIFGCGVLTRDHTLTLPCLVFFFFFFSKSAGELSFFLV